MKNPKSSLVLIGLALVLVIIAVVLMTTKQQPQEPKAAEVKEQTIPLTMEDLKDEPSLQGAVEQQLQQQQQQTPQNAAGAGSNNTDSQYLQPVPTSPQNTLQQ
jgi:hypothetical protein